MHEFGKSIRAGIIHKDGSRTCLGEISRWYFGWEQPYWFKEPISLEPGDDVYIDCHFDNSAQNQPLVNGKRQTLRDIAWGEDNQEMCSGFLALGEVAE